MKMSKSSNLHKGRGRGGNISISNNVFLRKCPRMGRWSILFFIYCIICQFRNATKSFCQINLYLGADQRMGILKGVQIGAFEIGVGGRIFDPRMQLFLTPYFNVGRRGAKDKLMLEMLRLLFVLSYCDRIQSFYRINSMEYCIFLKHLN